jgi:hypothetical protein
MNLPGVLGKTKMMEMVDESVLALLVAQNIPLHIQLHFVAVKLMIMMLTVEVDNEHVVSQHLWHCSLTLLLLLLLLLLLV